MYFKILQALFDVQIPVLSIFEDALQTNRDSAVHVLYNLSHTGSKDGKALSKVKLYKLFELNI